MSDPTHPHRMAIVEIAKEMLAEDRARDPDWDPYEIARALADGLASDLATSICIQLRGVLYREGIEPRRGGAGESS